MIRLLFILLFIFSLNANSYPYTTQNPKEAAIIMILFAPFMSHRSKKLQTDFEYIELVDKNTSFQHFDLADFESLNNVDKNTSFLYLDLIDKNTNATSK